MLHSLTVLPISIAIGTAYAVLSNAEKRKQYDLYGEEKAHPSRQGHSHSHQGFEADISPEDLFNMFFGGGFPSSECAIGNNLFTLIYSASKVEYSDNNNVASFIYFR